MMKSKCKVMMIFLISMVISMLIRYLKVSITTLTYRLPFMNGLGRNDLNCGKTSHCFFIRATLLSILHCLSRDFLPSHHLILSYVTFFNSLKVKSALKGTRSEAVEVMQVKAKEIMNMLLKNYTALL